MTFPKDQDHQEMVADVMIHFWSVTDVIPHQNQPEGGPWRQEGPEVGHNVSDVPKVVNDVSNHFLVIVVMW